MDEFRELYQEMIVDHSKRPRNFRKISDADHTSRGHNPLCGDQLDVYIRLQENRIADISFEGSGCAISTSSASMMTDALLGKTLEEAEALFQHFHKMVTSSIDNVLVDPSLGKLAVFQGVCEFPARVKCASLAWHTVHNALAGTRETAKTE